MNIYAFKIHFENAMRANPDPVSVEAAWTYFKEMLPANLEGEYCEEFSFSASLAAPPFEDRFQIYFGRLIDAYQGQRWRTVEINFYFQYEMSPDLQRLLAELPACEVEFAWRKTDSAESIRQKLDAFGAYVDEKRELWATLREHAPIRHHIQFMILP